MDCHGVFLNSRNPGAMCKDAFPNRDGFPFETCIIMTINLTSDGWSEPDLPSATFFKKCDIFNLNVKCSLWFQETGLCGCIA